MNVNYYIIGSKYGQPDGSWLDVFPDMLKRKAVSVGWIDEYDLSELYGKDQEEIGKYLESEEVDSEPYRTLKLFLSLRPGDLIAVKDSGSPVGTQARLKIRAYAVVVERDGQIYFHDSKELGHLINVEYLEANISREFPLGYGKTIHHLTNLDHINQIFGLYYKGIESRNTEAFGKGSAKKNTKSQHRSGSSSYVADAAHNILQLAVYDYMCEKYSKKNVKMEKWRVDIILREGTTVTFYEIKPYNTAKQCIREALGQLIEYSWNVPTDAEKLNLAIVGPVEPDNEEREYIEYIKTNLQLPLEYAFFTEGRLIGSER